MRFVKISRMSDLVSIAEYISAFVSDKTSRRECGMISLGGLIGYLRQGCKLGLLSPSLGWRDGVRGLQGRVLG